MRCILAEQLHQAIARTRNPALDRAHRYLADIRSLLVRQPVAHTRISASR